MVYGADLEDLEQLAAAFRRAASTLQGDVASVGPLVMQSAWQGPDKEHFASIWMSHLAPKMRGVISELENAADRVLKNRDEQERASAAGGASGGMSASGRGAGKSLFTDSTSANARYQAKIAHKRELLALAGASYLNGEGELPPGWRHVTDADLLEMGLDPTLFKSLGGHFTSSVFVNEEGKYVLAFAGSNDKVDWQMNVTGGGLQWATEYDERAAHAAVALKSALMAKNVSSDDIEITGHSLGGRLSTVATAATGLRSYTFNAAGTSESALVMAEKIHLKNFGKYPPRNETAELINNTVHVGDPLTNFQSAQSGWVAQTLGETETVGTVADQQAEQSTIMTDEILSGRDITGGVNKYLRNFWAHPLENHSQERLDKALADEEEKYSGQ